MIPLIPIAMGLASTVPKIAEWLSGPEKEKAATQIIEVAKQVTGQESPEKAVKQIQKNDRQAEEFQKSMLGFEAAMITQINQTMRQEGQSDDPWRRRWRPYWGYVAGTAFGLQIVLIMVIGGWAVVFQPGRAEDILAALAGLASSLLPIWGMALAVLGVSVWKRSTDKAVQAVGQVPLGVIGALVERIRSKQK